MYGLSLGVARVSTTLPPAVYALLSGLNAATVGIIALAAVQLSEKAITDKLTRLLVFFAAVAGMLYTALWYFPLLMVVAGLATLVWDYRFLHRAVAALRSRGLLPSRRAAEPAVDAEASPPATAVENQEATYNTGRSSHDGRAAPSIRRAAATTPTEASDIDLSPARTPAAPPRQPLALKPSLFVLAAFLLSLTTLLVLRGTLPSPPLPLRLFTNLYLAGTLIFGGGPVVIPLLREYVVAESWVSARDFLLGLALIQAFPGPNFNFAVYLGALALSNPAAGAPSAALAGAVLGFVGIFTPGIAIVAGAMGVWRALRRRRWLGSVLRGVNAAAVGLVYTAVWRLWGMGYVDAGVAEGGSLGRGGWWVGIAAWSFVGGRWFGVPAPGGIVGGGVAGLLWFGVVGG